MLTIPKSILIQKFFAGKNKTIRYYGENDFSVDKKASDQTHIGFYRIPV